MRFVKKKNKKKVVPSTGCLSWYLMRLLNGNKETVNNNNKKFPKTRQKTKKWIIGGKSGILFLHVQTHL